MWVYGLGFRVGVRGRKVKVMGSAGFRFPWRTLPGPQTYVE